MYIVMQTRGFILNNFYAQNPIIISKIEEEPVFIPRKSTRSKALSELQINENISNVKRASKRKRGKDEHVLFDELSNAFLPLTLEGFF